MFISLEQAKSHLRVDDYDQDDDITLKIAGAEQIAVAYLNRNVYVDGAALTAAIALVPAALVTAAEAYATADADADLIDDAVTRSIEKAYAFEQYKAAIRSADATRNGIVIDDLIRGAMLLILGDLFENREDTVAGVSVTKLPNGARKVLSARSIEAM